MTVFNVLIASAVFSLAAALTSTIADLVSSFAAYCRISGCADMENATKRMVRG
jgi:hypothetical protein